MQSIHARVWAGLHVTCESCSPRVILERATACIQRPGLYRSAGGRGPRTFAPVVEDPGNVVNAIGLFHDPQKQVVVLGTFKTRAEPANLADDLPFAPPSCGTRTCS